MKALRVPLLVAGLVILSLLISSPSYTRESKKDALKLRKGPINGLSLNALSVKESIKPRKTYFSKPVLGPMNGLSLKSLYFKDGMKHKKAKSEPTMGLTQNGLSLNALSAKESIKPRKTYFSKPVQSPLNGLALNALSLMEQTKKPKKPKPVPDTGSARMGHDGNGLSAKAVFLSEGIKPRKIKAEKVTGWTSNSLSFQSLILKESIKPRKVNNSKPVLGPMNGLSQNALSLVEQIKPRKAKSGPVEAYQNGLSLDSLYAKEAAKSKNKRIGTRNGLSSNGVKPDGKYGNGYFNTSEKTKAQNIYQNLAAHPLSVVQE